MINEQLHNNDLNNIQLLPNALKLIKSSRKRFLQHAHMENVSNACRIFMSKMQEKGPLERYVHKWHVNIKTDLCFSRPHNN